MKEVLEYILQNEGITNTRLAAMLEVAPASITHIISGRNKPSYDFIVKLVETFPQYDARWVLTGKGNPMTGLSTQQNSDGELCLFELDNNQDERINSNSCSNNESPPKICTTNESLSTKIGDARLIVCFPDNTFVEYIKKQ